ncbi:hypothetical protein VFPPC_18254 [Pochonia chlamydosporia 170]|uniref:Uncharacterized protein n=1 Tax=Pochonia chlamydosporia 170 TaxID=1380566 RepID=A0A219AS43_METCM|nr:hypothetical protein VFPPC_18254 [Pochonia chlamydosporia 170]OWT43025.1 hypothetical protein VFPPC_18254 [Pochonia chlamydosporia 170]
MLSQGLTRCEGLRVHSTSSGLAQPNLTLFSPGISWASLIGPEGGTAPPVEICTRGLWISTTATLWDSAANAIRPSQVIYVAGPPAVSNSTSRKKPNPCRI